jgi:transglutaminase-like putative cysteine protease
MAALSTRLLPVPPMTTRVSAPGGAVITSVGADATRPSTRGERYTATATVPGSVADTSAPSDGSVLTSAQLAPYVALPPVSPVVTSTARQVTAVARTPLGRAEALVDWFRSGIFTYTLSPPPSPLGADPLVRFLATTRAGTCESFASAYAVMARSVGLPTRIAVGFTTGRVTAPGVTTVRGKDAHEWPEVYLGAGAGWVSFEPTPQLPSGELTPPGVVGPTGITLPPSSTPTTAHTSVPPTTPTTQPVPTSATTQPSSSAASTPTRSPVGHASSAWWLATTAVVIVVAAGVAVRRVRRRRPASAPAVRVRRANERADRALARAAMVRPPGRTLGAHADALGTLLERAPAPGTARHLAARDQLLTALRDLRIVGDALENAFYRPTSVGPGEALEAEEAQRRVTRALRHRPVRAVAARLETGARAPASR